jgi:type III pantothenate kinase
MSVPRAIPPSAIPRPAIRPPAMLLLDIGNSRIKWAGLQGSYRRGQRFAARGAIDLERFDARGGAMERLLESMGTRMRIVACNVAGAAVERRLRSLARRAAAHAPQFVRSAATAAGVRNAYAEPWRLGADRWAALIGAHFEHPGRPLCLVAVGTALTIDLLDERGRHRGGSIIPGPELMIKALLERTAGIRRRAGRNATQAMARAGAASGLFARDTRSAVTAGAVNAAAALIGESMRAARELLGRNPRLILSGGAADQVGSRLRVPYRREDELVLRGLAVLRSGRSQFD